jgi:hypothetical protein
LLNLESAERKAKSNIGKITAGNYLKWKIAQCLTKAGKYKVSSKFKSAVGGVALMALVLNSD